MRNFTLNRFPIKNLLFNSLLPPCGEYVLEFAKSRSRLCCFSNHAQLQSTNKTVETVKCNKHAILPCDSRSQAIFAEIVEPVIGKILREQLNFVAAECSSVMELSLHRSWGVQNGFEGGLFQNGQHFRENF